MGVIALGASKKEHKNGVKTGTLLKKVTRRLFLSMLTGTPRKSRQQYYYFNVFVLNKSCRSHMNAYSPLSYLTCLLLFRRPLVRRCRPYRHKPFVANLRNKTDKSKTQVQAGELVPSPLYHTTHTPTQE